MTPLLFPFLCNDCGCEQEAESAKALCKDCQGDDMSELCPCCGEKINKDYRICPECREQC